jgi:hypothetical protein
MEVSGRGEFFLEIFKKDSSEAGFLSILLKFF